MSAPPSSSRNASDAPDAASNRAMAELSIAPLATLRRDAEDDVLTSPIAPMSPVHDVHADNRSENVFGWVQPDEWDTVAGPNKDLFLRGRCVECEVPAPAASSPGRGITSIDGIEGVDVDDVLGGCGGPSCGYGATCCDYSRKASRGAAALPQRGAGSAAPRSTAGASTRPIFRDDDDDDESEEQARRRREKSDLGVTLIDIIHGRSCRPISLLDLRTFLLLQRLPNRRVPAYSPASDMAQSTLPDLDVFGALSGSTPAAVSSSAAAAGPSGQRQSRSFDEVDALDFLVAVERYKKKFRDLTKTERLRSPDSLTCRAAVQAHHRRQARSARASVELQQALATAHERNHDDDDDDDNVAAAAHNMTELEMLQSVKPRDVGIDVASQPLRVEFERIVTRYIGTCSGQSPVGSARERPGWLSRKLHKNSSDSTVVTVGGGAGGSADEEKTAAAAASRDHALFEATVPRLQWMTDVGVISQDVLDLALAEATFTSHPDALLPLADAIETYLSAHVVPFFFISVGKNLTGSTSRGRLAVGIVCTVIAVVFTVLLLLRPSPLVPHSHRGGTGGINRWWRLTLAPVWAAGVGYILAYRTGVCVWLTLRGNREPDEEEEREREDIRSRISDDAAGFSFAEVEADAEMKDDEVERRTNRWMAPELATLLMTGKMPRRSESIKNGVAGPGPTTAHRRHRSSVSVVVIGGGANQEKEKEGSRISPSPSASASGTRSIHQMPPTPPRLAHIVIPLDSSPSDVQHHQQDVPPFSRSKSVDFDASTRPCTTTTTMTTTGGGVIESPSSSPRTAAATRKPKSIFNGASSHNWRNDDLPSPSSPSSPTPVAVRGMVRGRRLPLLPLTVGVVKPPTRSTATALEESLVLAGGVGDPSSPVITRDALLFDPELARAVQAASSGGSRRPSVAVLASSGAGGGAVATTVVSQSFGSSTVGEAYTFAATATAAGGGDRRGSVSGGGGGGVVNVNGAVATPRQVRRPTSVAISCVSEGEVETETETEKEKKYISPSEYDDIEATAAVVSSSSSSSPSSSPRRRRRRGVRPDTARRRTPGSTPWIQTTWRSIQRWTGFAVGTEKVLDARVRRAQQVKALKALAYDAVVTVGVMVVVLAVP